MHTASGAMLPAERVESVMGTPAARELVPHDPRFSTRWHQHDYPSPYSRWNFHPEYEIHLITRGTGWYIVGDTIGNFGPGQLVLVGPELPHEWVSELGPGQVLVGRDVVLQFDDAWIRSCMALMPELADLDPTLRNSIRGIEFLGRTAEQGAELIERIGATRGTHRLVTTLELLRTLSSAPEAERRYLASEWIPTLNDADDVVAVNRTLRYISGNITDEVRLSTAAEMIGMSRSAFSRYFKRASGQTFSDVVKQLRVAHACKLLAGTSDPVASIASAVGYSNLSNFNRQFRAEMQCTPLRYRTQERSARPLGLR